MENQQPEPFHFCTELPTKTIVPDGWEFVKRFGDKVFLVSKCGDKEIPFCLCEEMYRPLYAWVRGFEEVQDSIGASSVRITPRQALARLLLADKPLVVSGKWLGTIMEPKLMQLGAGLVPIRQTQSGWTVTPIRCFLEWSWVEIAEPEAT